MAVKIAKVVEKSPKSLKKVSGGTFFWLFGAFFVIFGSRRGLFFDHFGDIGKRPRGDFFSTFNWFLDFPRESG